MNLSETHVLAAGKTALLLAAASVVASANGTGVDMNGLGARGHAAAVLTVGAATAGTLPTMDYKLQSSPDNSTWTDIPGAVATQTTTVAGTQLIPFLPGSVGRYIRGVATIGGTSSPAFPMSAVLVYWGP
jgi:hypothetical protein